MQPREIPKKIAGIEDFIRSSQILEEFLFFWISVFLEVFLVFPQTFIGRSHEDPAFFARGSRDEPGKRGVAQCCWGDPDGWLVPQSEE